MLTIKLETNKGAKWLTYFAGTYAAAVKHHRGAAVMYPDPVTNRPTRQIVTEVYYINQKRTKARPTK